tara:strand:+ start:173 stop:376 length:204 start_codon:yes stop_codon:yes gene_type:complete
MVDVEFLKRYQESVDRGEDDYSLIDESLIKPLKKDYTCWDDYWKSLINYLKETHKYTYGSKAKRGRC